MAVLVKVAVPFDNLPVPSAVGGVLVTSSNVTVSPSGGVVVPALTLAVRVTLPPTATVPAESVKAVLVAPCALRTTCCTAGDVLVTKFVSPL